jgi:hypothetical protein
MMFERKRQNVLQVCIGEFMILFHLSLKWNDLDNFPAHKNLIWPMNKNKSEPRTARKRN